eukprot:Awhi_evm1s11092
MTNGENVVSVVSHFVKYCATADDVYFKRELIYKSIQLADEFAPSTEWYIEITTELFEVGGNDLAEDIAYNIMTLLGEGEQNY